MNRVIFQNGFEKYNHENLTEYAVERLDFPKAKPYGWNNYPYDYWKIWVQKKGFKSEPSLKKTIRKIRCNCLEALLSRQCR